MFIELTVYAQYEQDTKILVNTSLISLVKESEGDSSFVCAGGNSWYVKESYEQVKSLLDVSSIG